MCKTKKDKKKKKETEDLDRDAINKESYTEELNFMSIFVYIIN